MSAIERGKTHVLYSKIGSTVSRNTVARSLNRPGKWNATVRSVFFIMFCYVMFLCIVYRAS